MVYHMYGVKIEGSIVSMIRSLIISFFIKVLPKIIITIISNIPYVVRKFSYSSLQIMYSRLRNGSTILPIIRNTVIIGYSRYSGDYAFIIIDGAILLNPSAQDYIKILLKKASNLKNGEEVFEGFCRAINQLDQQSAFEVKSLTPKLLEKKHPALIHKEDIINNTTVREGTYGFVATHLGNKYKQDDVIFNSTQMDKGTSIVSSKFCNGVKLESHVVAQNKLLNLKKEQAPLKTFFADNMDKKTLIINNFSDRPPEYQPGVYIIDMLSSSNALVVVNNYINCKVRMEEIGFSNDEIKFLETTISSGSIKGFDIVKNLYDTTHDN